MIEVADGYEEAFLAIAREFSLIAAKKHYGRTDVVRDESSPMKFYAVRHWSSASAAEACHADPDVAALMARLLQIARVTHVVNGVRRSGPMRVVPEARPARAMDTDRRIGFDRRHHDAVHGEGERRGAPDRRVGLRRLRGQPSIDLVAAARRARENAEARFSHFKVGAALEAADGSVIGGCNVENATYGLTICAERVAMFKAISDGHRNFVRIAIVADTPALTPPCGACRQILWEFGGNLEIILANLHGDVMTHALQALFPMPFDARNL